MKKEMNLFRLISEGGKYKLELCLEPLKSNIEKEIDEKEFNKLLFKYHYFKAEQQGSNILFKDNVEDDSHLHHMLKLEYKKDFRSYYQMA